MIGLSYTNPIWQWKMDLLMYLFPIDNGDFAPSHVTERAGKSSHSQSRGELAGKVAKSWGTQRPSDVFGQLFF